MPTWLPEPGNGPICLGFKGSDTNDWTAIRAETRDGLLFTPRYGDDRPTIWNPQDWGGRIPRTEVDAAVTDLFDRYAVKRMYAVPAGWRSEIGDWALRFGADHVIEWYADRPARMHPACVRFETDLASRRLKHDGCPVTEQHVANCRKMTRPGGAYVLGKPTDHQKIDAAIASVAAHEAAADARAAGWDDVDGRMFCL